MKAPRILVRILLLSALFAVPCFAQEVKLLPDAPQPHFNKKVFWTSVTALAAAKTFDAVETRRILNYPRGQESNPLYGKRPSPAKQGLINAAMFAGESLLFYKTEHSNKWYWRVAGRTNLSFTIEEHVRLGVCGAGLDPQGPNTQSCHRVGLF
jgi:hypothetical protein